MSMIENTLTRIAIDSVVTSFLDLATLIPVSAASADGYQTKEEGKVSIATKGDVGNSMCPYSYDMPNQAAAQFTGMENTKSKKYLVLSRANLRNTTLVAQKGMHEAFTPAGEGETIAEEETADPDEEDED